jgi:hypothetical protein
MKKSFNLKLFRKQAFYEDSRGYMSTFSRCWSNCYKKKMDSGMQPQKAWDSCLDEYQHSGKSGNWKLEYSSGSES